MTASDFYSLSIRHPCPFGSFPTLIHEYLSYYSTISKQQTPETSYTGAFEGFTHHAKCRLVQSRSSVSHAWKRWLDMAGVVQVGVG